MIWTLYYQADLIAFQRTRKGTPAPHLRADTILRPHTRLVRQAGAEFQTPLTPPTPAARHFCLRHNPVDYDGATLIANLQILHCKISLLK